VKNRSAADHRRQEEPANGKHARTLSHGPGQPGTPAPAIAKRYWGLSDEATLRDVVLVVRADEAHHRDVNHSFANEIAGLPAGNIAPCPPHVESVPTWKQAA